MVRMSEPETPAGLSPRCAFCNDSSDYILEVSDPAPDEEQVVDGELNLPICRGHLRAAKEGSLYG